jgi:hypothetical protein
MLELQLLQGRAILNGLHIRLHVRVRKSVSVPTALAALRDRTFEG